MAHPSSDSVPCAAPGLDTARADDGIDHLVFTHPKNYLGVPLAVTVDGATGALVVQHLVDLPGRAKRGAQALGLLDLAGNLTPRGDQVVATAVRAHGSPRAGLDALKNLSGSSRRFVTARPGWAPLARHLAHTYGPAQPIIDVLRGHRSLALPALVRHLAQDHPEYVVETFLQADDIAASDIGAEESLERADAYRGQAVYQLKSLLYHCGVLTQRGADTSRLEPPTDVWALESADALSEVSDDVA